MTAVPAFRALRMSPAEFCVAVRHHFAERQPVVTGVAVCGCGTAMGGGAMERIIWSAGVDARGTGSPGSTMRLSARWRA